MNKAKFKFENIKTYTYLLTAIMFLISFFYFYSFINEYVIKAISSTEVSLDPATIRISDVNIDRFKEISSKVEKKANSRRVSSRNIFK